MQLLESLKWRYATKKYDPARKITEGDLEKIQEAIQLSASSYGLQLYKVLMIKDPEIRAQLKEVSWGQTQITDASALLVFCNYTDARDEYIDDYVSLNAQTRGLKEEDLKGYGDFIKSKMKDTSLPKKQSWMARQTYIALSNAMNACAELEIDSTPMEGFEASEYDKILNLEDKGLMSSVVLAIGYRSEEDSTQHAKKVRKPLQDIFEVV